MDTRRRSFNKFDAKDPLVTKASDNRAFETHATAPYSPICSYNLWFHVLQPNLYLRESVIIFGTEKIWRVIDREWIKTASHFALHTKVVMD